MEINELLLVSSLLVVALVLIHLSYRRLKIAYCDNKEGDACEGVYINQLQELESRVAFLELKEYDPADFVEFSEDELIRYGWNVVAKSEKDYGEKIRVGKNTLHRQQITQTNQQYYEYAIYVESNAWVQRSNISKGTIRQF